MPTMKFTFVFGGSAMDTEHAPLARSYLKKIQNHFPAEIEVITSKERDEEKAKKDTSSKIMARLKKCDAVILFDERGKDMGSSQYAKLVERFIQGGRKHVGIVIGGAHGVDSLLRERASAVVSFSSMIFPHQLARIMAIEQTYRALDIIRGGKYHHE
jgi:23S rRNA (pseudouridine1915-N3)-methyltransferase